MITASALAPAAAALPAAVQASIGSRSAAAAQWRTAQEIPPPVTSSTIFGVRPQAVSCWARGDCVAGGYVQTAPPSGATGYGYQDFAIVATESGGHWHRFATLTPPPDAVAGNPTAQVTSISCPAKWHCMAVGYYTGTIPDNTGVHGFMASYRNGAWAQAVTVPLPAGQIGYSGLSSVSCASRSSCVAIGSYGSAAFPAGGKPFSVTYSQGSWQRRAVWQPRHVRAARLVLTSRWCPRTNARS
jgi:hypothetical protein